jgi:hypothetical protein
MVGHGRPPPPHHFAALVAVVSVLVFGALGWLAIDNLFSTLNSLGTGEGGPSGLRAIGTTGLTLIGAVAFRLAVDRLLPPRDSGPSLEDRVDELAANLKTAAGVIDEMEAEVQQRTRALERARKEVERAKREVDENRALAQVDAAAREAMAGIVQGAARDSDRRSWTRDSVMLVAGVVLGQLVDSVIHWLG